MESTGGTTTSSSRNPDDTSGFQIFTSGFQIFTSRFQIFISGFRIRTGRFWQIPGLLYKILNDKYSMLKQIIDRIFTHNSQIVKVL